MVKSNCTFRLQKYNICAKSPFIFEKKLKSYGSRLLSVKLSRSRNVYKDMRYLYKLIVGVVVGAIFLSCEGESKKPQEKNQAKNKIMVVGKHDMTLYHEYSARFTGCQIVEIRPQVTGKITHIYINEGDKVHRGQTLFVIDQVPYLAAIREATAARKMCEAKLATARMNYNNEVKLQQSNVVSDYSVETMLNALHEAEAALAQAQAREAEANNNLSYTTVRSPLNGVASMIPWHVGSLVSSNISEPLVTVADDHEIYAYFSISDNEAMGLVRKYGSVDQFIAHAPSVSLKVGGEDYKSEGRISAMSGTVTSTTGAVTLRATFPNPQHLLHDGGSGTIKSPIYRPDCITIPQEATYELQNRTFVYKVVGGKTKATPVTLFPQNNGREYIVEDGLQVGDTIVAEGAGLLKEGVTICK